MARQPARGAPRWATDVSTLEEVASTVIGYGLVYDTKDGRLLDGSACVLRDGWPETLMNP